ncbi:MAG: DNA polymerase III subunit chi [Thiomargarita sp.]|nr:DNA polymerase III subunit chi [Thiomargarita sp.]
MSQVNFYILNTRSRQEKLRLTCQLADKVWHQGYRIYIQVDTYMLEQLDVALWTFKKGSFLAHDICSENSTFATPILIGHTEQYGGKNNANVLINLTATVPTFFKQFERIAEIVDDTDSEREMGRTRYRFYQEQNFTLQVHNITR